MQEQQQQKLIHTFSALADIGQEVAHKNNFQEMIQTSLHLLLGSLAIMRGGVARYSKFGHELNFLAVRGLGDDFPLSASLEMSDEREFLNTGMSDIELSQAKMLAFFQRYQKVLDRKRIEMISMKPTKKKMTERKRYITSGTSFRSALFPNRS